VLSGFLITALLLIEHADSGSIRLRDFWARRARRLGPAVLVLIALVIVFLRVAGGRISGSVFGDGMASSFWVANWRFVFTHRPYADLFSAPSPFAHMWSLAVEEQVYLLLPPILLLALGRRSAHSHKWRAAAIFAGGVVASTLAAAWLHGRGGGSLHEYYGTDARAAEPLVGALLAMALIGGGSLRAFGRVARAALDAAAVAGAGVLVVMIATLGQQRDGLYRGGLLLAALSSAAIVAAATQPGLVSRVLGTQPLAALGRVSYGAYLFHWPIFLWMTAARTGLSPAALLAARTTVTLVLASVSYRVIELPVRRGRFRWPVLAPGWATATVGVLGGLALATTATPAVMGSNLFAAAPTAAPPPPVTAPAPAAAAAAPTTVVASNGAAGRSAASLAASSSARTDAGSTTASTAPRDAPNPFAAPPSSPNGTYSPPPTATANRLRVAIVGDSMAAALATGMKAWAANRTDVVVYDLSTPGCPLSRGGVRRFPNDEDWSVPDVCGWWGDTSSSRYNGFVSFDPQVVIVQDGMNEVPDRKIPQWPDFRHTGQPLFDQWLLSEYQSAVATFSAHGAKVLMLNPVCADWQLVGGPWADYTQGSEGDHRVASLNTTTQGVATTGARIADFNSELCPGGKFTQKVDGVGNARPDGYHLSSAASAAIARDWLGPMALQLQPTVPTAPIH
jgi:peptidoglycan/LPS O-acetylase OafA/YrhL